MTLRTRLGAALAAAVVGVTVPPDPAAAAVVVQRCDLTQPDSEAVAVVVATATVAGPAVGVRVECVVTGAAAGRVVGVGPGTTAVAAGTLPARDGSVTLCVSTFVVGADGSTSDVPGGCRTVQLGLRVDYGCGGGELANDAVPGAAALHGWATVTSYGVTTRLLWSLELECVATTASGATHTVVTTSPFAPAAAVVQPLPLAPGDRVVQVCAAVDVWWLLAEFYYDEQCWSA